MVVDALGFVSVQHQGNVVVLMFLSGTFPDCDIRRVVTRSLTVFDEGLLKLAEEFVVIRMPVAFGESDIIPHKEDFAVTVAHIGHQLINLLQYRFFTAKLFLFVGHDRMSLILLLVGDSFISHAAVSLLLCFSLCRDEPPVMSKALTGGSYRYYQLTCF